MTNELPTRDELAEKYLAQLLYEPYPVQEEALLTWFTSDEGVLVCAPTGTGKTLIAHAALFEALHRGETAYYTTPLIALTEQKFSELTAAAVRWGFDPRDVGLVTGNRRVNPEARVLVVVAEILLNRLLNTSTFDFSKVSAVVMDEFHSFAEPERGVVWELSLSMLPEHVKLLLLSATVGNAPEFLSWLARSHGRKPELVQDDHRKVPLTYRWVGDQFLGDQLEIMAQGRDEERTTPALVFCFNREECWTVAEHLKGKDLLTAHQRDQLKEELKHHDLSNGAGPKVKQLLMRGVGVHHAGVMPRYKRLIEDLYVRKMLSVCVCTETLAAGINLPARSVVLTTLLKGPPTKKKLIFASTAHQIFGRAGRPQFDDQGYVYALAHEDDVRILRWQEKYDSLPENSKDPGILKAKKALKKKRPTRREGQQYWNEAQFQKLIGSPPGNLYSKGPLPWRLLAYLLQKSPDVDALRTFAKKRLMDPPRLEAGVRKLHDMLLTLWAGGYVALDPEPPQKPKTVITQEDEEPRPAGLLEEIKGQLSVTATLTSEKNEDDDRQADDEPKPYQPHQATPTSKAEKLLVFRGVHPLYGAFLLDHLGKASFEERIQALESVLELPRPLLRFTRVPFGDDFPPGPLEVERLDPLLIKRGLLVAGEDGLAAAGDEDDVEDEFAKKYPPTFAEKLRMLFDSEYPGLDDVRTQSVWAAGELLRFGGDFNKYVRTHNLVKQEGIIFRHVLRLILLCAEFSVLCPEDADPEEWRGQLKDLAGTLTEACRKIDPESTDKVMEQVHAADVVEGESHAFQGELNEENWRAEWDANWDTMLEELKSEHESIR